jgi:transcriptional regulator with XRE-family HTH domain
MDTNLLKQIIGYRIIESRWEIGMEQKQLEADCDYEKGYISRIEHAKVLPETGTINLIAEKLHKAPWQLMKPWKNSKGRIKEMQFIIKKYHGRLPPFVKKKMEKKK